MKKTMLLATIAMLSLTVQAQVKRQYALPENTPTAEDPVIMTVNGQPVLRSEFEYSYNKNNSEGVIDKKTVEEYVPLFVNYKLKVAAAVSEGIDTTAAFINEFVSYRDGQVRPTLVTDADVEAHARKMYDEAKASCDAAGGMYRPSHIFFYTPQNTAVEFVQAKRQRADSVLQAIKGGTITYEDAAKQYSEDPTSSKNGGDMGWIQPGTVFPEFEKAVLALKDGEMSGVVQSPAGFHIVKMGGRQDFFPYDSVHQEILQFIEVRNLRDAIVSDKLQKQADAMGEDVTPETILDQLAWNMQQTDPDMRNLIREYHDGLLLFEVSNREVWDKAAKDEKGLEQYFLNHRKDYTWDEPRFKGMVYHVKDAATEKAVKKSVKNLPFEEWKETLRTTFNNDSVIRIRVELGRFQPGDNKWVDQKVFKKKVTPDANKNYPIENVFGRKLKAPADYQDVRAQVVADYQEYLEQEWVKQLRQRYQVTVNDDVVATVNKH